MFACTLGVNGARGSKKVMGFRLWVRELAGFVIRTFFVWSGGWFFASHFVCYKFRSIIEFLAFCLCYIVPSLTESMWLGLGIVGWNRG
jgi:hypothetical protein